MANPETKPNIMIIAGEPSGDARGAELIHALKPLAGDVSFWGFGGDLMSQEGVEIVRHVRELSMVGAVEIIHKLPDIWRHYRQIVTLVKKRKPIMAVLIDYPGFNMKVAGYLKSASVPVVYYIIPQVWAWGKWRIKKIKRFVRKALVLFPFEETLLRENGIDCDFVGHPLSDSFAGKVPAADIAENGTGLNIALLPGSRRHEINNMLPVMLGAAEIIRKTSPSARFLLAESPNIDKKIYDSFLSSHKDLAVERFRGNTAGTLSACSFAVITSGTATLEGAMMEKPMVIVYKASRMTYLFYLLLSRVPFLGLVNIIAGKEVVPELLQNKFTSKNLAHAILEIAKNPERMAAIKKDLGKVRISLGGQGAAKRAAERIADLRKHLYGNS
ncbi:MAG: lipid-A-disaccharide synthase [Candidatus Omnitrophota bacterium]